MTGGATTVSYAVVAGNCGMGAMSGTIGGTKTSGSAATGSGAGTAATGAYALTLRVFFLPPHMKTH